MAFVLVFFSPFSIAIASLGEERANLSDFVRLFYLYLFEFVGFLFLLVSGKGCGLCLWHSRDFSLTFFFLLKSTNLFPTFRCKYDNMTLEVKYS